ncbi:MAG: serine/threonine protein phosphatase [Clostridia bacterium]|nr:serine/threonine protein phosphatase [Clostridia bacterium]
MKLFTKRKNHDESAAVVQTVGRDVQNPLVRAMSQTSFIGSEYELYRALRDNIPVIDAALDKLVRLVGDFHIICEDKALQCEIEDFLSTVLTGGRAGGIQEFKSVYLNQLLTYGTAVGEIVLTGDGRDIYSLMNVPLKNIRLGFAENLVDVLVYPAAIFGENEPFKYQELLLVSALTPEPGRPEGISLLHGLEFVSDILMKIYNTIGINWERIGNVRFAVTYKPSGDGDRAMSRQRAQQIADEWSKAMRDSTAVSDFVSVGDVSIKVIGADNQILDSEIPVRQMLEQIVSKLSVPPFLLGLSWSTTERMSSQQADILTSEIEYYRGVLNSVIKRIVRLWMRLHGKESYFDIEWESVNLQDEISLAHAALYRAQARSLEEGEFADE